MFSLRSGRNSLITTIIMVAILIPSITLIPGIQSVRLEQVVFALILPFTLRRDWRWWNYPFIRATLLLACSFIASFVFSKLFLHQSINLRDLTEFIRLIMLCALFLGIRVICTSRGEGDVQQVAMVAALAAGVLVVAFSVAQYLNLLNVNSWLTGLYTPVDQMEGLTASIRRVVGTFGNPNVVGVFLVLIFLLALSGFLNRGLPISTRLTFGGVAVLTVIAIVLTVSRTAFLALGISGVFFLTNYLYREKTNWPTILLICLSFILAGWVLWQIAPSDFVFRMKEALHVKTSTSIQARFVVWNDAWSYIKLSPVFGWGPAKTTMPVVLDNEYLLILRRYGILGIVGYLVFFATMFWQAGKSIVGRNFGKMNSLAFQAWLVAILIYNISAGTFYNMQLMSLVVVFAGLTAVEPIRFVSGKGELVQ